ncbi:unnamed protein product [Phaeothamnion confervicola]
MRGKLQRYRARAPALARKVEAALEATERSTAAAASTKEAGTSLQTQQQILQLQIRLSDLHSSPPLDAPPPPSPPPQLDDTPPAAYDWPPSPVRPHGDGSGGGTANGMSPAAAAFAAGPGGSAGSARTSPAFFDQTSWLMEVAGDVLETDGGGGSGSNGVLWPGAAATNGIYQNGGDHDGAYRTGTNGHPASAAASAEPGPRERYEETTRLLLQCAQLTAVSRSQLARAAQLCADCRASSRGNGNGYNGVNGGGYGRASRGYGRGFSNGGTLRNSDNGLAAGLDSLQSSCRALADLNEKRAALEAAADAALAALGPPASDDDCSSGDSGGGNNTSWVTAVQMRQVRADAAAGAALEMAALESEKRKLREKLALCQGQLQRLLEQAVSPPPPPPAPQKAAIMVSDSPSPRAQRRRSGSGRYGGSYDGSYGGSGGCSGGGGSGGGGGDGRKRPHWSDVLLDVQERDEWVQRVRRLEAENANLARRAEEAAALSAALRVSLQRAMGDAPLPRQPPPSPPRASSGDVAGTAMATCGGGGNGDRERYQIPDLRRTEIESVADVVVVAANNEDDVVGGGGSGDGNGRAAAAFFGTGLAASSSSAPTSMVSVALGPAGDDGQSPTPTPLPPPPSQQRLAAVGQDHYGSPAELETKPSRQSLAGRIVTAVPRGIWAVARGAWGAVAAPASLPPPRRQHAVLVM